MKRIFTFFLATIAIKSAMVAQTCTAIPVITLSPAGVGGIATHMMVAYNPINNVYYWNSGGFVSNAIASYSATGGGTLAAAMGNQDWRGLWWNSNTNKLEGNCFSSAGIFTVALLPNGNPAGGSTIVASNSQPNAQVGGQYDPIANQVLYYNGSGGIAKYSRVTGLLVTTIAITGLPVGIANLATYGFYTGIPGVEYAVYDYVNRRAYYINYATGAYVSTVQFPPSAGAPASYALSYANGIFFIYDNTNWVGFRAGIYASATSLSLCSGSGATLTAVGGTNYTWTPSGLNTSTIAVTPTVTSFYTVAATASIGCLSSMSLTITVNTNPTISVNSGSICSGNSFTMVPSGANTYTFQGGSAVVSPTANASYTVVGTSTAGCVSQTFATSNLTVSLSPTISVNSGSVCSGNSFTIVPSGANTYTIQGGSAVVTPTANASYTVIGTSTAGCISQTFAISNVTINASPLPTVAVNSGSICAGNAFTIVPTGANSYTIQGGSAVVSPTANASYTVVGTNTAGCLSQTFATSAVTVGALPSLTVAGAGTICASTGTANLIVSGANTYSWNTGSTSASIAVSPSATAIYTATGTSSITGCTGTVSATIVVSPCTGINQIGFQNSMLSLSPNPSNGEFTIELNNGLNKLIEVIDLTGRVLLTNSTSNDKVNVNINYLANGIYYIKIQSSNVIEVVKVIKQ